MTTTMYEEETNTLALTSRRFISPRLRGYAVIRHATMALKGIDECTPDEEFEDLCELCGAFFDGCDVCNGLAYCREGCPVRIPSR